MLHNPDFPAKMKVVCWGPDSAWCPATPTMCLPSSDATEISESWRSEVFCRGCSNLLATASNGQAARAGGAKPGRENAAAQVDTQRDLANGPSESHGHTRIHPRRKKVKAEIVSVPVKDNWWKQKLILTFFCSSLGIFIQKAKTEKMFGFWQSKTGNFLATNQNNLGFLGFGFVLGFRQTP